MPRLLTPDRIRNATLGIAVVRGALGVGTVVAPRRALGALGLSSDGSAVSDAVMRWFGVREIVLAGIAVRAVGDGYPSSHLTRLNAWCDAGDSLAMLGLARRRGPAVMTLLGMASAATVCASQIAMARALDEAAG